MNYARVQRKYWSIAIITLIGLVYLHTTLRPFSGESAHLSPEPLKHDGQKTDHAAGAAPAASSVALQPKCKTLPGANDTVVIMKTGATELQDKLPIHLTTTHRCYPHLLLVSDYAEDFEGLVVHDALMDVDVQIRDSHADFALWRRLKGEGRSALNATELSGPGARLPDGNGKPTNPGWKLDKWKFLPMMSKTLEEFPDKKWYVFVETDTYMFWSSWLAYAAELDWQKPYYMGAQVNIGDIAFAHGGSGFAVSRPALEHVVKHYKSHKPDWEKFTDGHWAGDCILGKAFADSGTPLMRAWPIWQGDPVHNMNYDRVDNDRQLWCHPSVSYHHLTPSVIEDMWKYEQRWLDGHENTTIPYHRHSDVYADYVLPKTQSSRDNWDNYAKDDKGSVESPDACRALCQADETCLQYILNDQSTCLTTGRPNSGEPADGMHSGWIQDRMQAFYDTAPSCDIARWITEY
ncbi:hypothetical protein B0A48_13519 [Cryoendolithus antarcticus]|uniref:Apple domain-containing protein n=1 Tax=Cryoendolithus antarcticus TaxID=1507870 RepID=A0A1V8SPK0_9PEZI|nr:hypothetical protein B0A48_13519 [Cryoendolithus antarcticus]